MRSAALAGTSLASARDMAPRSSQRLSAVDATFLDIETETAPMNVGALVIFDAGPLALPDGGIDFERIRAHVASRLEYAHRNRQRLERVPGFRHPVWVDDEGFDLDYHLRHVRLPAPGSERQLKRLAGQLLSEPLDRSRPLWTYWVIEGLEGERFALVAKAHHAMVDGLAGIGLLASLLRTDEDARTSAPREWRPRRAPSRLVLVERELAHRIRGAREGPALGARLLREARGISGILGSAIAPATPTSLNPRTIRSYRRLETYSCPLSSVKAVKRALGGTVNDVVLAMTTGGLRRFLARRGDAIERLTRFRAMLPVDVAVRGPARPLGNHVALCLCDLPITEPDPRKRYATIVERTRYLKARSHQARAAEVIEEVSDVTSRSLVRMVFRTARRLRTFNVVVTNMRGPSEPLYLLGARARAIHPMVPLFGNQALGVTIMSYDRRLFLGLPASFSEVRDLHYLPMDLDAALEELRALARADAAAMQWS